jgi:hypothetical protein
MEFTKRTDFRIGNLVEDENGFYQIEDEYLDEDYFNTLQCWGIKITKDVLIKLGFEPKEYEFQIETGLFIFAFDIELNLIIHWGTGQLDEGLNDIIYVHQLQNLYFALTGEELTLLRA